MSKQKVFELAKVELKAPNPKHYILMVAYPHPPSAAASPSGI